MAKSTNKNNLIFIPIIYIAYALLLPGIEFGFATIDLEKHLRCSFEYHSNYTNVCNIYFYRWRFVLFDKKSNFYNLLPLAFVVL